MIPRNKEITITSEEKDASRDLLQAAHDENLNAFQNILNIRRYDINKKINFRDRNEDVSLCGFTLLMTAIYFGGSKVALFLLTLPDCDVTQCNDDGDNPLILSIRYSPAFVTAEILKKITNLEVINHKNNSNNNALSFAVLPLYQHKGAVELIQTRIVTLANVKEEKIIPQVENLQQAPSVNTLLVKPNLAEKISQKSFFDACQNGPLEVVKQYIKERSDINILYNDVEPALMLAISSNQLPIVFSLLDDYRIKPFLSHQGETKFNALHLSVKMDQALVVENIVAKATLDELLIKSYDNETAAEIAYKRGKKNLGDFIIKRIQELTPIETINENISKPSANVQTQFVIKGPGGPHEPTNQIEEYKPVTEPTPSDKEVELEEKKSNYIVTEPEEINSSHNSIEVDATQSYVISQLDLQKLNRVHELAAEMQKISQEFMAAYASLSPELRATVKQATVNTTSNPELSESKLASNQNIQSQEEANKFVNTTAENPNCVFAPSSPKDNLNSNQDNKASEEEFFRKFGKL